jgi:Ca2+-binding EF-hand superfamily protein
LTLNNDEQMHLDDLFDPDEEDEEDEEWIREEREEFLLDLDKDGDSYLDADEIFAWILPDDFDHAREESQHLIEAADINQVCGSRIRMFCVGCCVLLCLEVCFFSSDKLLLLGIWY